MRWDLPEVADRVVFMDQGVITEEGTRGNI